MENQQASTEQQLYRVFDEMGFEVLLLTNSLKEAHNMAYNYQCVIIDNITNKVLKDYSC